METPTSKNKDDHRQEFIDKLARAMLSTLGVDSFHEEDGEPLNLLQQEIKNNKSI